MTSYTQLNIPVSGGELVGGVWSPEPVTNLPPVLAIHGITASHVSWPLVAERLGTQVIAMDLRGRGGSNTLPGPFDLRSHARDMQDVLDHLGVERVIVAGHSMGAFVAVRLAELDPARVASLVLIDGGLPISPPEGVDPAELPALVLGPALSRLSMTFASRKDYTAFWRDHAALGPYWNTTIERYVDYDLQGEAPHLRPSSNADAVTENALELDGSAGYSTGLATLELPIDFLRAPRGLADEQPLYPASEIAILKRQFSRIVFAELDDVNHYTVVLGPAGAAQVARVIEQRIDEEQLASTIQKEVLA